MRTGTSAGIAVAAAIAFYGCAGGVSDPTATETRVYTQFVAPSQAAAAADVRLGSRGGTVEVVADWTLAGNNIDVYATSADCFDFSTSVIAVTQCLALAEAAGQTVKPERLTLSGAAGGTYRLFVVNRGSQPDTVTVRLTIH